jgi:hypothetical protein
MRAPFFQILKPIKSQHSLGMSKQSAISEGKTAWPCPSGPILASWQLILFGENPKRWFYLRFALLRTFNDFKRQVHVDAFMQEHNQYSQIVSRDFDHDEVTTADTAGIAVGDQAISFFKSEGNIRYLGQKLTWQLQIEPTFDFHFPAIHRKLLQSRLRKTQHQSQCLWASGSLHAGSETILWKNTPGLFTYTQSRVADHCWASIYCKEFTDPEGLPVRLTFEAIASRTSFAGLPGPCVYQVCIQMQENNLLFMGMSNPLQKCQFNEDTFSFTLFSKSGKLQGISRANLKNKLSFTEQDTKQKLFTRNVCCFSSLSLTLKLNHEKPLILESKTGAFLETVFRS